MWAIFQKKQQKKTHIRQKNGLKKLLSKLVCFWNWIESETMKATPTEINFIDRMVSKFMSSRFRYKQKNIEEMKLYTEVHYQNPKDKLLVSYNMYFFATRTNLTQVIFNAQIIATNRI